MSEGTWQVTHKSGGEDAKVFSPFFTFAVIVLLLVSDYVAFRLFDHNYFRWYLDHGTLIALAFSFVAIAVELDREPSLVAAHPGSYTAGWFAILGETFEFLSDIVRNRAVGFFDSLFTSLYVVTVFVLCVSWLIVIAPVQYFITLVTGAPARSALVSRRMWIKRTGKRIELFRGPASEMPEGAEEIGLARRPVSVTSAITAGVLFIVSMFAPSPSPTKRQNRESTALVAQSRDRRSHDREGLTNHPAPDASAKLCARFRAGVSDSSCARPRRSRSW
jgi:hypothetical protein